MLQNYFDGTWQTGPILYPSNDLGLQRGFGIFETLRAKKNTIFQPELHLERLRASAQQIGLPYHWSDEEMLKIWQDGLGKNQLPETNLKVIVTGGSSSFLAQEHEPLLAVFYSEFHARPPECYSEGVGVRTTRLVREMPSVKSLSYLTSVLAWRAAQERGDHEGLFLGQADQVLECTTANFFIVRNGQILTAKNDVLAGTTRNLVLRLAAEATIAAGEGSFTLTDALRADEAFLTSVNRRVMPVVRIDGQPIGGGEVGAITRRLMTAFATFEQAYFSGLKGAQ